MKKALCSIMTLCLLAGQFIVPASAEQDLLQDWEKLSNPVYVMDFSPEDGVFYDSPAGATGRMEVGRIDNPEGIVLVDGTSNAGNQIINLQGDSNTSRIFATQANKDYYSAFSGGVEANDINAGASGAKDDYCLRISDTGTAGSGTAKINFPEIYGGAEDSYHKYRFEMDWKWNTIYGTAPSTNYGSPTGATILVFYIGNRRICLNTKNAAAGKDDANNIPADARGAGAFYFQGYSSTTGTGSAFGLTASAQSTKEEEINNVTKSAAALTAAEAGKWVHITVDFDFQKGTIDLLIEGDTETRQISTGITANKEDFAAGIKGVGISASTGGDRRINFVDNVKITPINSLSVPLSAGEVLGDNAYLMDFTPEEGKFYDFPKGTEGRTEVERVDAPSDIVVLPDSGTNADNKIISNNTTKKLYASQTAKNLYVAYSNSGASGADDDYCLKSVDATSADSNIAWTKITLPKTYGGTEDSSHKYRFEADWKWQAYSNLTTASAAGSPTGTNIMTFYIGNNKVHLNCSPSTDTDVRGGGTFRFYEADKAGDTVFGLTGSSQRTTDTALINSVTKSAAALTEAESGKWVHITIDFDFAAGTIYAAIEGDSEKRVISTNITKGNDTFAKGISAIDMRGSNKGAIRVNYVDNISLTPIMTKEPVVKAQGNQIKWKAVTGADSYNVYYGNSESEALESTTPIDVVLDTESEPGYVIAAFDNIEVNKSYYYTVTAVSGNKGESIKSNVAELINPQNIISDINFVMTDVSQELAEGKASVNINAGIGFENDLILYAAVYENEALINVSVSKPVTLNKGDQKTIEVPLGGLSKTPTDEMKMKFFLWDTNFNPVIDNSELSAQEWKDLVG